MLVFFLPTLEIDVKKSAKWRNFIKKVDAAGCSICYARRSESDLEKFLCREARKRGCTLSRALAGRILRYTGSDLNALTNEIQKLCAFAGGGEITGDQIEEIVTKNMETTVFLLSNALVRGDYSKAYTLLDLLISQGEKPITILSVLSGAYIDMYRVRAAIESGKTSRAPAEYGDYKGRDFRLKYAERDMRDLFPRGPARKHRAAARVRPLPEVLERRRDGPHRAGKALFEAALCGAPRPCGLNRGARW